jgi:uncharacterized protein (TIGR03663 family)
MMTAAGKIGRAGLAGAEQPSQSVARVMTTEAALYVAIGILAALLRLWSLDGWPLRAGEAAQAMAALNLARGGPIGAAGNYSPILMAGNFLLFALFSATDYTARLWPALCGAVLALTPALLRRQLGQAGALLAALFLAFSPSLLAASRLLDGQIVAVTAGALLLAALARLADAGERKDLLLGAAALALGLLSAPAFYLELILLLTGVGLLWALQRALGLEPFFAGLRAAWTSLGQQAGLWRTAGLLLAGLVVALGSALSFNWDGLGAAAGLLPAWIAWLAPGRASLTPLWMLAMYETLLLGFGVAGVVAGIRRRDALSWLLGWWLVFGLLVSLVAGRWQPVDLSLLALPLALLAGSFLGRLAASLAEERLAEVEWLLIGLVVPMAVFGYVQLTSYTRSEQGSFILGMLAPAVIYLVTFLLVGAWMGWRRALRGMALAMALFTFVLLVSNAFASSANFDMERRDAFNMNRSDEGVRDLVAVMQRYSWQTARDANAAPILVVGDELRWLQWALRDFRDVKFVASFDNAADRTLILTPAGQEPALGDQFAGQDIVVASVWQPARLSGQALASWLLYRRPAEPPLQQKVIMWAQRAAPEQ